MTWLLPLLIGALAGAATIALMARFGLLRERSGLAVLLAAVAAVYPVFALDQGDIDAAALHSAIFLCFAALALQGFRKSSYLLAGGLIGHGFFDLAFFVLPAPGPVWWPAACAGFDILAGAVLVRLIQTRQVPQ